MLLPRTAEVEGTLALLLQQRPLDDDESTAAVLALLDEHGCLDRSRPAAGGTVAVLGRFEAPGLPDLEALLATAGLTITASPANADVVLVLALGELDRDLLDPLIRSRTSHLVVRMVDAGAVLGPFVVPGVTACLRCVDAHQSLLDPDHVAVTSRYLRATAVPRDDGVPDVPDASLVALALSWATRDVVAHLEGRSRRPSRAPSGSTGNPPVGRSCGGCGIQTADAAGPRSTPRQAR